MSYSSDVANGDIIRALHYNNLRADVVETKHKVMIGIGSNTGNPVGTAETIPYNTVILDDLDEFDTSYHGFTPNRAGHYLIIAQVAAAINTAYGAGSFEMRLYKNYVDTNSVPIGIVKQASAAGHTAMLQISQVVYLNGSTDYVEVRLATTGYATLAYSQDMYNFFSAIWVSE